MDPHARKREVSAPDLDAIEADARSIDDERCDAGCRAIHRLVAARERGRADHGDCPPSVRAHALALIERCLRDVRWLARAGLQRPTRPRVALAALLLTSRDPTLSAVGRPLARALLTRWALADPAAMLPLLEALALLDPHVDARRATLPEAAPLLAAIAVDPAAPVEARREAIEALGLQGEPEHAGLVAHLTHDDAVAGAVVPVVHALDLTCLAPEPLLQRPATRAIVATAYARELAPRCFDELLAVLDELSGHPRRALLDALMATGDARLVPTALDCSTRPGETVVSLRWLREQTLTDAQLAELMGQRFEWRFATAWLAALARAQGRLVSVPRVASLPPRDRPPDEGSASLVGYVALVERASWLREHLATADRRTLLGIVIGLARVGGPVDLGLLRALGEGASWLRTPTALARMLLGDRLELAERVVPTSPFAAWALERLVERHGRRAPLIAATTRASEGGLHPPDLGEFRRVIARLRDPSRARS